MEAVPFKNYISRVTWARPTVSLNELVLRGMNRGRSLSFLKYNSINGRKSSIP